MYYGIIKYSFDSEKPVLGPYATEEEAWAGIEKSADEEYRIAKDVNEWECEIHKDKDCGEIVLTEYFDDRNDVTEFFIIEINNTKLI